jgi:hypothetical protein
MPGPRNLKRGKKTHIRQAKTKPAAAERVSLEDITNRANKDEARAVSTERAPWPKVLEPSAPTPTRPLEEGSLSMPDGIHVSAAPPSDSPPKLATPHREHSPRSRTPLNEPHTPPPSTHHKHPDESKIHEESENTSIPDAFAPPCIEHAGGGPRVRDPAAFLRSRFAHPPALDDSLCAEFAVPEVLEMLCTVLPPELAMVCGQLSYSLLVC